MLMVVQSSNLKKRNQFEGENPPYTYNKFSDRDYSPPNNGKSNDTETI